MANLLCEMTMMNKEQLGKIKQLHEMSEEYPEHKDVIDVELLRKGVPTLIEEVERLQQFERKAIYVIGENKRLREALEIIATDGALSSIEIMRLAEKMLKGANDNE